MYLLWHPFKNTNLYFFCCRFSLGQTLPLTVMVFPKNYGTQLVKLDDYDVSG